MKDPEQIARETAEQYCRECQEFRDGFRANTSDLVGLIQQAIERAIGGEENQIALTAEGQKIELSTMSRKDLLAVTRIEHDRCVQLQARVKELEGQLKKSLEAEVKLQDRIAYYSGALTRSQYECREYFERLAPSQREMNDAARIVALTQERDAAQQELGNLYAAIFRDGGHEYQRLGENSYDAAVEKVLGAYSKMDADAIVIDILKDDLADAQQKVREVEKKLAKRAEIKRLKSRLEAAKEALRPFAEKAKHHDAGALKERPDGFDVGNEYTFPIGILRAAQRTLAELDNPK